MHDIPKYLGIPRRSYEYHTLPCGCIAWLEPDSVQLYIADVDMELCDRDDIHEVVRTWSDVLGAQRALREMTDDDAIARWRDEEARRRRYLDTLLAATDA